MNSKKLLFYFYILPVLIFILASVLLFAINQNFLSKNIEKTYFDRLNFLGVFFKAELAKERNYKNLTFLRDKIIKEFYKSKDVVYYAFRFNKDNLWSWSSKYEGFLPIFGFYPKKDIKIRVIKTPVGRIFELNVKENFSKKEIVLTIGFMQAYSNIIKTAHLRILLIFNILIVIFLFLYYIKIMEYNHSVIEREKLIEKERREKEVFRTLSTLSMALSHELRNPLNSLNLIFEKITIETNKNILADLAKKGGQEIERIKRFTKSFEMLLKKESEGKSNIGIQIKDKINLKNLISLILDSLLKDYDISPKLKEKGDSYYVMGDRELLSILFYYLLKACFEGAGKEGFITILIDYNNNQIKIKNSGKAVFTEELLSHSEKVTKNDSQIGNTIFLIKKIIDFHNWKISFESYELGDIIIINFKGGGRNYKA